MQELLDRTESGSKMDTASSTGIHDYFGGGGEGGARECFCPFLGLICPSPWNCLPQPFNIQFPLPLDFGTRHFPPFEQNSEINRVLSDIRKLLIKL